MGSKVLTLMTLQGPLLGQMVPVSSHTTSHWKTGRTSPDLHSWAMTLLRSFFVFVLFLFLFCFPFLVEIIFLMERRNIFFLYKVTHIIQPLRYYLLFYFVFILFFILLGALWFNFQYGLIAENLIENSQLGIVFQGLLVNSTISSIRNLFSVYINFLGLL